MDKRKVVSNQHFEPSQKWKAYNKKKKSSEFDTSKRTSLASSDCGSYYNQDKSMLEYFQAGAEFHESFEEEDDDHNSIFMEDKDLKENGSSDKLDENF